jgi:hypothetical protein
MIMHKGEKLMEGPPHALVEQAIERFVLEVRGGDASSRLAGRPAGSGLRVEAGPEALRVFSSDHAALRALAADLGAGAFNVRETNLEDLFLQATGSTLDE